MSASVGRGNMSQSSQIKVPLSLNRKQVSYARITQVEVCPKKDQSIVLDAIEGITIREYAIAIGTIIGPENISHISRISYGRICLYLSSVEIVNKLVDIHKQVTINEHSIEIRPLISRHKRVIFSNVPALIPSTVLENKLLEYNVSPKSQITRIRSGLTDPGYTHILSFRRQVYVDQDDLKNLPQSMQIVYDKTTYWVYISDEKVTCFLCKEVGHVAKSCKNFENSQDIPLTINTPDTIQCNPVEEDMQDASETPVQTAITKNSTLDDTPKPDLNINEKMDTEIKTFKRPLPSSTTSSISEKILSAKDSTANMHSPSRNNKDSKNSRKTLKKIRTVQPVLADIEDHLKPAEAYFEKNEISIPISFTVLTKFLMDTYGKSEVVNLAREVTPDLSILTQILKEVQQQILNKSLISRISRLVKKLDNPDKNSGNEESSSTEE